MFGYVRIYKDKLSLEDFEKFRAYYCGLCKALGKYSSFARLGLSYDMTFLLVLLSATEKEDKILNTRCMLHPYKKEKKIEDSEILDYVASVSIVLAYRKLEDDWKDDKSLKALMGMLFYKSALKKAGKKIPDQDRIISECIKKLSLFEKDSSKTIDLLADCFAKLCEGIFTPTYIEDENQKRALGWLGYNIGRWIYLIDALDDLEEDIRKKKFNPFKNSVDNDISKIETFKKEREVTLTYTLSNISAAYDLIKIKQNDSIIKNILYLGLPSMQNSILNKQEGKNGPI